MPLIAICIRLTSKGPAIFAQKRVGQGGRLFSIYKFRSMTVGAEKRGAGLTKSGDRRVTTVGKWLRRFKLDELPQFYNVLRGDMSIVGPRPKLPEFADHLNLAYRPGVTGAASLAFRREEEMLAAVPAHHVEAYYHQRIKPLKASIDARYGLRATFRSDLRVIVSTLVASLKSEPDRVLQSSESRTRARAGLFAVHLSQIRTTRPLDHVTTGTRDL
jgi:lipopolysaccharide/colanic/teichoic acid biosynthesis glycosyltransferase